MKKCSFSHLKPNYLAHFLLLHRWFFLILKMTVEPKKVLISGAGIVGLLTAQALKARGIDFIVFDRDCDVQFRESAGWAITLHWALDNFLSLLPPHLALEIYDAQVRKDFHLHDTGNFRYIDAATGKTVVAIPPSKRLRVRREQIRRTLLKGIEVQWNCKLTDISDTEDGVKVTCASGKTFEGDILLGCEGSNSATRKILCGEKGNLNYLPIRFCGAKVQMSKEETDDIAERFDPLLFQGTVPTNETFFWFSMLATPEYTKQDDVYYAQVNLSWKYDQSEPFASPQDKAKALVSHAEGLHPDLQALVLRAAHVPAQLVEIKLADWPMVEWDTKNSKILLMGDAAHAMTMYRGEAANHGITDVFELMKQMDQYVIGGISWETVVDQYCQAVKSRAGEAVLLSRQACIDAHDITKISANSTSPLLSMRKKK